MIFYFKKLCKLFTAIIVSVGLISSFSTSAQAVSRHPESRTPDSAYLEYATNFPSVGYLYGLVGGEASTFSSGVLIGPLDHQGAAHWVLTSGHGTDQTEGIGAVPYDEYIFGLGSDVRGGDFGEYRYTDEVFFHPEYTYPDEGVDLALLYFEEGFTTANPSLIHEDALQAGELISIVGYGRSGPHFGNVPSETNGIKRAAKNVVDSTTRNPGYAEYEFRSPSEQNYQPLGGQGMYGDSGGGWFVETESGFDLVAISSDGIGGFALYGAETSGALVTPVYDWIEATIASKQVPEPTSLVLLSSACLVIGLCRTRRQ